MNEQQGAQAGVKQDAYSERDRNRVHFPEGLLTLLGALLGLVALVMLIISAATLDPDLAFGAIPVVSGAVGLLIFAALFRVLHDIREYLAKLNRRLSGEPSRERQESAS